MQAMTTNLLGQPTRTLVLILALGLALSGSALAAGAVAPRAMVATDHELASQAAVSILRAGGNAMDAAVAAAFVLGVVNPQSSGLGGGGFLLYHEAASGRVFALEYRDRAPRRAPEALERLGHGGKRRFNGLSAAVPAEAVGLEAARLRFGTMGREQLLAPAIRLAREGFPVGRLLVLMARDYLDSSSARTVEVDRLVTRRDGRGCLREDDWLCQPALARTLELVASRGPGAVTSGPLARAIVRAASRYDGVMEVADLAQASAHWVEPLRRRYRGADLFAMPPPASGAVTLMALRLVEPEPLPSMGPGSVSGTAALARALQRAMAAKWAHLGDPAFTSVPLDTFLESAPAQGTEPGAYADEDEPQASETTNLCVVDERGNAVAMTTSLGAAFGCRVLVPECGFLLSSHVADFAPAPGKPNAYGVRYGPPNVVAPGKASVSSATPMLAFRDGKLKLAVGGSGSGRIVPAVTQVLVDVLDFGLRPGEAVASPRFQVSGRSRAVWLEPDYPLRARLGLPLAGLPVNVGVKRASVTAVEARPGHLFGGSDPRKFGVPLGY